MNGDGEEVVFYTAGQPWDILRIEYTGGYRGVPVEILSMTRYPSSVRVGASPRRTRRSLFSS